MVSTKAQKLDRLNHGYINQELYGELIVCSNTLINTEYIFLTDDGWSPLVIRKGEKPRVWLSLRDYPKDDKGNITKNEFSYLDLVVDSQSMHNQVNVISNENGIQIKIADIIILEAGNHESNSLEVYNLNLRPLGLNISGDHKSISIGNNQLSRNSVANSKSMFGI